MGAEVGSSVGAEASKKQEPTSACAEVGKPPETQPESPDDYYLDDPLI